MDMTKLRGAVREGLNRLSPKPEVDEDIKIYDRLQPSDFPKLIEKYGEEPVLSYIKTMEARKMRMKNA